MRRLQRGCVVFRGVLLVLVAASTFSASGCRAPRPVPTSECVTDYDRMSDDYEPLASLVYIPDSNGPARYRAVAVGPFAVGSGVEPRERAFGYATLFRVLLKRELEKLEEFESVALESGGAGSAHGSGDELRLEGMVTRFDMGSGTMRYMHGLLPLLPSGATDLQVEGRLMEGATGKVLLEFVDRRRGIYNTPFGPTPRNLREERFAMDLTARDTAACLAELIRQWHEALRDVGNAARPGRAN